MAAPLCEPPAYDKAATIETFEATYGFPLPRLYALGFPHNNCGGGCVKAGQGQFVHLLEVLPEVYAKWETGEQRMRKLLGKDVAILRDRRGGQTRPLTLTQLRRRVQGGQTVDRQEVGGCGCFVDDDPETVLPLRQDDPGRHETAG